MREHLKIVAILHIVLGFLGLFAGLSFLTMFGFIGALIGTRGDSTGLAAPIVGGIVTVAALFILALSVPGIIGGFGLLRFRPWARTLLIVISILDLLNCPIGTALGAYGLVILFNGKTVRLFENGGVDVAHPQYAGTPAQG